MLRRLHFSNFKAWSEADLLCGKITGVFGTNSSGKTSLIQFILLLKQTKDATDRALTLELNGDLVKLGTIRDVIYRHDETKVISWSADFELASDLTLTDVSAAIRPARIARGRDLIVGSDISDRSGAPVATSLRYKMAGQTFALTERDAEPPRFALTPSRDDPGPGGFAFVRTTGRPWQLPGPVKGYAFPDQARTYYQNSGFLADLQAAYEAELDNTFYLGPLRDYPQRDYLWARSRPTDVGWRGEKVIDAILAATAANERRNVQRHSHTMPFQQMVAYWLKQMGLIFDFRVEEIKEGSNRWQAKVKTRRDAQEVLLTDVGFGVSQVLPVVTLLQYVPEGATVILEQPEIHLHPLAQAGLADVIVQAAKHRNVQILLESHSEHLLLRLQRRIAEEKISSDEVKLYFCDAPTGTSSLTPLDVDMFGNIRNWPDKFMGDAFTETAEAERARLKRMIAAE